MTLDHKYGASGIFSGDRSGIIYTCELGFVDLGHLRDLADLTLHYYLWLSREDNATSGSIITPFGYEGEVVLLQDISKDDVLNVASSMAYDESVFHEIETYWSTDLGDHYSSFSPEDLVSNALGTYVARLAIDSSPDTAWDLDKFNKEVTNNIYSTLTILGAQSRAGTLEALSKIENRWVAGIFVPIPGTPGVQGYLHRRNFGFPIVRPVIWTVPNVTGCGVGLPSLPWLSSLLGSTQSYYRATYTESYKAGPLGKPVSVVTGEPLEPFTTTNVDFQADIGSIKAHAQIKYGADFDKP